MPRALRAPRLSAPHIGRVDREFPEQVALVGWAAGVRILGLPGRLGDYLIAIPNGGYRTARAAARAKAEGAKAGVSDLFLAVPAHGRHGLWIELKAARPHSSSVSPAQRQWQELMRAMGYDAVVARGFEEGRQAIEQYLRGELSA